MGRSPVRNQAWKAVAGQINTISAHTQTGEKISATLSAPGIDLSHARIVWEAREQEPAFGKNFAFAPAQSGSQWIEAEAQLPDGRRIFAVTNFVAK
jgi:hypothetical protein